MFFFGADGQDFEEDFQRFSCYLGKTSNSSGKDFQVFWRKLPSLLGKDTKSSGEDH